jgi:hypothetical protein
MRELTKAEKQFVIEAEQGCFTVGYEDDGTPYAMGAPSTSNLFTMDVEERPTPEGAVYTLHA